ncbi:MAG: FkbM family methyltransferase [Planctomycetales bacterium]|nr:FkbM family methyltransferase [Planctomycetales bacterium]
MATRTRFLRGVYEPEQAELTSRLLGSGDVFWDIGAHFGYYTLLASRAVASASRNERPGMVCSFEPVPANQWFLERHVRWNRLNHTRIMRCAVAGRDGEATFQRSGTGSGRLSNEGELTVPTRSIDSLAAGELPPPTCMKIDVEGAEAEVLLGAKQTLAQHSVLLIVALHGPQATSDCLEIVSDYKCGFVHLPSRALIIAHTDPAQLPRLLVERYLGDNATMARAS